MNNRIATFLRVFLLFVVLLFVAGCNVTRLETGPTQTDTQTVEMGDANSVDAQIAMGVGELSVSGGSSELLDAAFTYNVADWKPVVEYAVSGGRGKLVVHQPEVNFEDEPVIPDENLEYSWDLRLNDEVPLTLDIDLGVGEGDLQLGGLNLTSLKVNTGVGKSTIDFSGKWQESFAVDINTGVGEVVIRLPNDVGVRAEVDTGLGDVNANGLNQNGNTYTNDAYGDAAVSLEMRIKGGVGAIRLELAE